jgi:hypothetical protein
MEKQTLNSYDDTKKMLATIRNIQNSSRSSIREQVEQPQQQPQQQPNYQQQGSENHDVAVINNVEVNINSEDSMDLEIKDEEKGKISQLIDDFRTEVSELADFGKLNLYSNGAKLDGQISEMNIGFTISAGDDNGVYLTNTQMLKLTDETLDIITKLKQFEVKFTGTMNEIILTRKQN